MKINLFQSYNYSIRSYTLHKYSLDDFSALSYLCENNKLTLDMTITTESLRIKANMGKGYTEYVVIPMSCDQDDEDFLFKED